MAKRRLTVREQVLTLLTSRTQKEVAKILGVSDRTIRRWKNENTTPKPESEQKLFRRARNERARIKQAQATFQTRDPKSGKLLKKPIPFTPLPIQIYGVRKTLKDYSTGGYRLSENIFFDVERLNDSDIFRMLQVLRDKHQYAGFQITMRGPAKPEYPMGYYMGHLIEFYHRHGKLLDTDLLDFINEERNYVDRIVQVMVYPPPKRRSKRRQKPMLKRGGKR